MINQEGCDLLASLDFHKPKSVEAGLFSKFLTEEYDSKVLTFFLYLRCLIERELKIKFSKIGSISTKRVTDIRDVHLSLKQCRKVSSVFYDKDEEGLTKMMDNIQSEIKRENFGTKIPAIRYQLLMVNEFQLSRQETTDVMQESYNSITKESPEQEEVLPEPSEKEENVLHYYESEEGSPEKLQPAQLKESLSDFMFSHRLPQMISYSIKTYEEDLSPELLDLLQQEIQTSMVQKIGDMLSQLFEYNVEGWFQVLLVPEPSQDQIAYCE